MFRAVRNQAPAIIPSEAEECVVVARDVEDVPRGSPARDPVSCSAQVAAVTHAPIGPVDKHWDAGMAERVHHVVVANNEHVFSPAVPTPNCKEEFMDA